MHSSTHIYNGVDEESRVRDPAPLSAREPLALSVGHAFFHKNYEALQASASANKVQSVEAEVKEIKNISRSEYYSFTNTGIFRP